MKLFLDDIRYPPDEPGWLIARGLPDFKVQILAHHNSIDVISFDHDLGSMNGVEYPSGMDCAKWLIDWVQDNPGCLHSLTEIRVHSANPVGSDNIKGIFRSATKQDILKVVVR